MMGKRRRLEQRRAEGDTEGWEVLVLIWDARWLGSKCLALGAICICVSAEEGRYPKRSVPRVNYTTFLAADPDAADDRLIRKLSSALGDGAELS